MKLSGDGPFLDWSVGELDWPSRLWPTPIRSASLTTFPQYLTGIPRLSRLTPITRSTLPQVFPAFSCSRIRLRPLGPSAARWDWKQGAETTLGGRTIPTSTL